MTTRIDSEGRLHLPEDVRERYGERFHVVTYENRIELVPVADDPLEAVREAATGLRDASVEDVRDAAQSAVEGDEN